MFRGCFLSTKCGAPLKNSTQKEHLVELYMLPYISYVHRLKKKLKGEGHTSSTTPVSKLEFDEPRLKSFGLDVHVSNYEELGFKVSLLFSG